MPQAGQLASAAADTTATGARGGTPTLCHGLAGSITLLLDAGSQLGTRRWAGQLTDLARLLRAFVRPGPGGLICPGENPDIPTPDLMVGAAGVALCFLKLSEPSTSTGPLHTRLFAH
jgi:hypothetical protein